MHTITEKKVRKWAAVLCWHLTVRCKSIDFGLAKLGHTLHWPSLLIRTKWKKTTSSKHIINSTNNFFYRILKECWLFLVSFFSIPSFFLCELSYFWSMVICDFPKYKMFISYLPFWFLFFFWFSVTAEKWNT